MTPPPRSLLRFRKRHLDAFSIIACGQFCDEDRCANASSQTILDIINPGFVRASAEAVFRRQLAEILEVYFCPSNGLASIS